MTDAPVLSPFSKISTPCIGVCSTVIGDSVCRGCKRYSHEIIHWNSFNEEQKRLIDQRLEGFLKQVMAAYIQVVDADLLRQKVRQYKIRVAKHRGHANAAYELLRAGGDQVSPFENFGLQPTRTYESWSATHIKEAIDKDFFELSSAHFDRYFRL